MAHRNSNMKFIKLSNFPLALCFIHFVFKSVHFDSLVNLSNIFLRNGTSADFSYVWAYESIVMAGYQKLTPSHLSIYPHMSDISCCLEPNRCTHTSITYMSFDRGSHTARKGENTAELRLFTPKLNKYPPSLWQFSIHSCSFYIQLDY